MLIPIVMAVSLALNAQANRQYRVGNFEQAEQTYRLVLAIGPNDPAAAMILNNLAGVENALGRSREAEDLATHSIAMLEQAGGSNTVLLLPALNTLGAVYIHTGRYRQAELVLKRAVRLGPGEAGAHYATSLHNLAAVYHIRGEFDRADKLYRKALRIRLRLFGPEDPLTVATVRNIRMLDQASTRLARASKSNPENSPR